MSIRVLALYLLVAGLSIYAWKDWFKSLCGLILLMAVMQHEDMPTTILGIQGLNPWNVLFVSVFLARMAHGNGDGHRWDMPYHVTVLLWLYVGVILVGFLRAVLDPSHIEHHGLTSLVSEQLVNTLKWLLPGLLLFDACRTRRRLVIALVSVLVMYALIAGLLIKRMPPASAFGGVSQRTRMNACQDIGYSSCDMSPFLGGASWGIVATLPLVRTRKHRLMVLVVVGIVVFAQALTGGRAGYVAWGATGLTLCLVKWRKQLILAPILLLLLPVLLPGATARMLHGFGNTDASGETAVDDSVVTSGRTVIWSYVIDKIGESPWVGHGRLAMNRTGLTALIDFEAPGTGAPHPHNMYLEMLLDNGILGSLPIVLFWGTMLIYSTRLFRSANRLYSAVGGVALAAMLVQVVAGLGSQHVYPRESTVGMWTAVFLMLRVHVEEKRAQEVWQVQEVSIDSAPCAERQATCLPSQEALSR